MAIKVDHNEIQGTVVEAKRWCRSKVKEAQKELTDEYMQFASDEIRRKLMGLEEYRKAKTILLYANSGKEVITINAKNKPINDLAFCNRKPGLELALPLCVDTKTHRMEARLWNAEYRLKPGAYGIPEPDSKAPVIDPKDIDLVVLPCVSCDHKLNRLGHGAGYYDRYLDDLAEDCVTVALCYEKIMLDEIPTEPHDKKVDMVITEENIYGK